jgi:hypothetical protein
MSSKSRQTIYGGSIMGAKIRAEGARKRAMEAIREADRAEAEAPRRSRWKAMAGPRSPHRPSVNASMAGSAGFQWRKLGVVCRGADTNGVPDFRHDALPVAAQITQRRYRAAKNN